MARCELPVDIFVFGSNLRGVHGAGAALTAARQYGALAGQGVGLQGRAYAIPTKDRSLHTLPLAQIKAHVLAFRRYASTREHIHRYLLTAVGCGLAGYHPRQIAPLFASAARLPNVYVPEAWLGFIEHTPRVSFDLNDRPVRRNDRA